MKVIDKVIEILKRTNDGDDLYPTHLSLLETAVNNYECLTEKGREVLETIYNQSLENKYKAPYLHNIENLTIDCEGYVQWRGVEVEHYTLSWAFSEKAKECAKELAIRCRLLEFLGAIPTTLTAIWDFPECLAVYK